MKSILTLLFFSHKEIYMSIQIGDRLPSIQLQEGTPGTTHDMAELFAGKKELFLPYLVLLLPDAAKLTYRVLWLMQTQSKPKEST
jgi:hypothetical protein